MKYKKSLIRKLLMVFLIFIAFITIFAIKDSDSKKQIDMIYISKSIDEKNEFWMALISGAKMAAKEYNVNLTIVAPKDEANYEEQNELIKDAIKKKPSVILLSPSSYTKTIPMAEEIKRKGIKLVIIDCTVNSNVADSIVSTDNFAAGQKMGKYIKEFIEADTKIAVVSHVKQSSTAIERENGLRNGLEKYEDKIIEVVFCESRYDKAYILTKQIIEKNPDINMIAALNEYSSVGVAKAVKELGLENEMLIIGFDNSIEEVKLLEEGVLDGIIVQKPFNMGYFGVEQAIKIVKREKYDDYVDCGSQLIKKEYMYTGENQRMLFPFIGKQFREVTE